MKKILKYALLFSFALPTTNLLWQNLSFSTIPWTIIKVALVLSLFEIILKPIVKIITLPINILTLGLFRIVINTLGLYLAVFLFSDFQVSNISNISISLLGYNSPLLNFNGFWCYLITSFTISLILIFFNFIVRKKSKNV